MIKRLAEYTKNLNIQGRASRKLGSVFLILQELLHGRPDELLRVAAERGIPHLDIWPSNWLTNLFKLTLIRWQPGTRANKTKVMEAIAKTILLVPPGWMISPRQKKKIHRRLASLHANTGASLVTCDDWVLKHNRGWHWRRKPLEDRIFDQRTNIGSGPILIAKGLSSNIKKFIAPAHSPEWRQELIRLASESGGHTHLQLPLAKAPKDEPIRPNDYAEFSQQLENPTRPTDDDGLISVLIPTAGTRKSLPSGSKILVRNCIQRLAEISSYRNLEIILIDGEELPMDLINELEDITEKAFGIDRWRLIRDKHDYTYTRRINLAAAAAKGDFILQLNDDTEILRPDGIGHLMKSLKIHKVGIVGALLLYPNGRVQHIGTSLDNLAPRHAWAGCRPSDLPWGSLESPRQFHAVTAAVSLCRRSLWQELNGMSNKFPVNYGDVDFCLRASEIGKITIVEPKSCWLHYESASRQTQEVPPELRIFKDTWGEKMGSENYVDPYCSTWRYLLSRPIRK